MWLLALGDRAGETVILLWDGEHKRANMSVMRETDVGRGGRLAGVFSPRDGLQHRRNNVPVTVAMHVSPRYPRVCVCVNVRCLSCGANCVAVNNAMMKYEYTLLLQRNRRANLYSTLPCVLRKP